MDVCGNNLDAQTERTPEEKLNIASETKINTKHYLKNGESGGYHTDRN